MWLRSLNGALAHLHGVWVARNRMGVLVVYNSILHFHGIYLPEVSQLEETPSRLARKYPNIDLR